MPIFSQTLTALVSVTSGARQTSHPGLWTGPSHTSTTPGKAIGDQEQCTSYYFESAAVNNQTTITACVFPLKGKPFSIYDSLYGFEMFKRFVTRDQVRSGERNVNKRRINPRTVRSIHLIPSSINRVAATRTIRLLLILLIMMRVRRNFIHEFTKHVQDTDVKYT